MRVDTLAELVLSSRVCNTVPVRSEVGAFSISSERTVSEKLIDRLQIEFESAARCRRPDLTVKNALKLVYRFL